MWRGTGISADSFYEVWPQCIDHVPKPRFKIRIGKTLSRRKWHAAFSAEGYLDIGNTLCGYNMGEFILRSEDKCGNSYLVVMIHKAHLMKERLFDRKGGPSTLCGRLCRKLFPVIGSGRFVTVPIINEEGEPIQDPLVLKEANFDNGSTILAQKNHDETVDGYASSPTNNSNDNEPVGIVSYGSIDKKEIQWKSYPTSNRS